MLEQQPSCPNGESRQAARGRHQWLLVALTALIAAAGGFWFFQLWAPPARVPQDAGVIPRVTPPSVESPSSEQPGKSSILAEKTPSVEGNGTPPRDGKGPSFSPRPDDAGGETKAAESMAGLPDPAAPVPTTPEALFEEATRFVDVLTRTYPNVPDALEVKARFLEWLGKSKEAVACWERALQLDPSYAYAHFGLGSVAAKNEDYATAAERLRRAVELNPGYFPARLALGDALLALRRPKDVIDLLEEYSRRDPRSQGFFLLGQAYAQLQQYEKAKENLEAAVRKYPEYGEAYYRLSTVCARLGQQDQARKYLERSRKLKAAQRENERVARKQYDDLETARTRVAETYTNAARIYMADGKPRAAERLWHRAADLDAKNVECRQGLAWLCRQEGRIAETIALLEQLAKIDTQNPSYRPEIERLRATLPK